MTWAKIDTALHRNPNVRMAGRASTGGVSMRVNMDSSVASDPPQSAWPCRASGDSGIFGVQS